MTRKFLSRVVIALAVLVLVPSMALAQAGSSIGGGVTDNTGGVLPGVTVEASSPALIEGSRVAFTDGQGRYSITDLRPGPYSLTFTLPGFSTIIRDQLDLAGNFAMTIDIEMRIGAIEESVTVSGESPVVDVQQTTRSQALTASCSTRFRPAATFSRPASSSRVSSSIARRSVSRRRPSKPI